MTIPKDNSQLENARRLRREMTPHERKLWYLFLRKYPVKIYKQRIIGRNFHGVCEHIDLTIQNRLQDPLSHLR